MAKREKARTYEEMTSELAKVQRKLLETNLALRCVRAGLRKAMRERISRRPTGNEG
jgi:hypothetical protein